MNADKHFLLALTSAAFFSAAPILAQEIPKPDNSVPPVAVYSDPTVIDPVPVSDVIPVPTHQRPWFEYALDIKGEAGRISISRGVPEMPVALMVGLEDLYVPLPYGAKLRVDPLAIFVLGPFNEAGEFHLDVSPVYPEPVPHFEFFVQALSAEDWVKLCTSELLWVRTDLGDDWRFEPRG